MVSALLTSIIFIAQQLLFIILGLFGIGLLIGIHEFGHFLFCKLFRIRTPSFSIGMGPRLIEKKIGDTVFTLSALPIGGYVEIAGSKEVGQGEQHEAGRDDEFSFTRKPYYQKMLVMSGGILFNIFFSYFALSLLFFIGMPQTPLLYPSYASTIVKNIVDNSPAHKVGLQKGDTLVAFNDVSLQNSPEKLIQNIKSHPTENIILTIKRNKNIKKIPVTLGTQTVKDKTFGYLGVEFTIPQFSFFESIKHGINATHILIGRIVTIFKQIFTKQAFNNLGGPLMVISHTVQGAAKGFKVFLLFLAFISVNLAVLNIVPVPIMDGGQALFYTIEAIAGRKIPDRIREYIYYTCWIGFLILIIYLSIKDIIRLAFTQ